QHLPIGRKRHVLERVPVPVQRYAVRQAEGELYRIRWGRIGMSKCIEESNYSDRNDCYNQHHLRTPRASRKQGTGTGRSCSRFIRPFELIPCRHRAYVTAERVPSGNSLELGPAWPTFHFFT